MTQNPPILRDSALLMPAAMALGAIIAGPKVAVFTGICGVIALVNMALLMRFSGSFTSSLAAEEGDATWPGLLLVAKLSLAVPLALIGVLIFGPIPVVLGLTTVIVGTATAGISQALSHSENTIEEQS